jgi:hypothetical protein
MVIDRCRRSVGVDSKSTILKNNEDCCCRSSDRKILIRYFGYYVQYGLSTVSTLLSYRAHTYPVVLSAITAVQDTYKHIPRYYVKYLGILHYQGSPWGGASARTVNAGTPCGGTSARTGNLGIRGTGTYQRTDYLGASRRRGSRPAQVT